MLKVIKVPSFAYTYRGVPAVVIQGEMDSRQDGMLFFIHYIITFGFVSAILPHFAIYILILQFLIFITVMPLKSHLNATLLIVTIAAAVYYFRAIHENF